MVIEGKKAEGGFVNLIKVFRMTLIPDGAWVRGLYNIDFR